VAQGESGPSYSGLLRVARNDSLLLQDWSYSSRYVYDVDEDQSPTQVSDAARVIQHAVVLLKPTLSRLAGLLREEKDDLVAKDFLSLSSHLLKCVTDDLEREGNKLRGAAKYFRLLMWEFIRFLSFREQEGASATALLSLSSAPSLSLADEFDALLFIVQKKLADFVPAYVAADINCHLIGQQESGGKKKGSAVKAVGAGTAGEGPDKEQQEAARKQKRQEQKAANEAKYKGQKYVAPEDGSGRVTI